MRTVRLDAEARDAFLADVRLGILSMRRGSGSPLAVPLWFRWDGEQVEMVSKRESSKVRQLERDPRASLLVTNIPPEPSRWVAFDGRVEIRHERGQQTAERLTRRYLCGASEFELREAFGCLRRLHLVQLRLEPDRIRTYAEVRCGVPLRPREEVRR